MLDPPVKLPSLEIKANDSGPIPVLGLVRQRLLVTYETDLRSTGVCVPACIDKLQCDVHDGLVVQ